MAIPAFANYQSSIEKFGSEMADFFRQQDINNKINSLKLDIEYWEDYIKELQEHSHERPADVTERELLYCGTKLDEAKQNLDVYITSVAEYLI